MKDVDEDVSTASKNANCVHFTICNNLIPLFTLENINKDSTKQTAALDQSSDTNDEMSTKMEHLNGHSMFNANVVFCIAGYIDSTLLDNLSCPQCK